MQIKPNITKIICKRTYILSGVILLEEFPSPNSPLSKSGGLCSSTHSTNLTLALTYYQELIQDRVDKTEKILILIEPIF